MKTDRILILTDDTPSCDNVARFGFNLAMGLAAEVLLLSVIEPMMTAGNTDAGIFPDDALMTQKNKTRDILAGIRNKYGTGLRTETLIREGEILATVMDVIQSLGIDLVIAGSKTSHGLSKLLGDDIAKSIIRHSPVPVCIVPLIN